MQTVNLLVVQPEGLDNDRPFSGLVPSMLTPEVRKQQLELRMEQQTDSKSGNENFKAVYCHPAYLTYMQSTS